MRASLIFAALLIATPALAQEPVGCDKFKWPLDREKAMLATAAPAPSDGMIAAPLASAYKVTLAPYDSAKIPNTPSRPPKAGSMAGTVTVASPPQAGTYKISLDQGAWIDVFQKGQEVKSGAFSGAQGCDGIRKSVKFNLAAEPLTLLITGTTASAISFVITTDDNK
ncbi:MAG: hypothetical protein JO254_05965 [Pseudolabrys sp.]|nr:hypothetical protein [Pseudolabrys sp.]